MPVQLGSKLPAEAEARIEIIPLIDILFFLLAAFMLVSLGLVNLKSVKVNLPTATAAATTAESRADFLSVSVDRSGMLYYERTPIAPGELAARLAQEHRTNADVRVFISADRDTRHGEVIRALDLVRSSGIDRVAFEIRGEPASGGTP